jgi:hypothetical protein
MASLAATCCKALWNRAHALRVPLIPNAPRCNAQSPPPRSRKLLVSLHFYRYFYSCSNRHTRHWCLLLSTLFRPCLPTVALTPRDPTAAVAESCMLHNVLVLDALHCIALHEQRLIMVSRGGCVCLFVACACSALLIVLFTKSIASFMTRTFQPTVNRCNALAWRLQNSPPWLLGSTRSSVVYASYKPLADREPRCQCNCTW